MPEANAKQNNENNVSKPVIVNVKPGLSSEKGIQLLLPQEMYNTSITEIINYVLSDEVSKDNRNKERIAEKVKKEMKEKYGITINSQVIQGNERAQTYFVAKTSEQGREYDELEIIIAADNSGGLVSRLYR